MTFICQQTPASFLQRNYGNPLCFTTSSSFLGYCGPEKDNLNFEVRLARWNKNTLWRGQNPSKRELQKVPRCGGAIQMPDPVARASPENRPVLPAVMHGAADTRPNWA